MSASSGTLRAKLPIAPPRSVFGATEGHPDTIQNDVGLYHMLYVNFLTALLLCLCSSPLHSAVVFSESVNGPLSSSGNTPTILSLSPGSNNLISSFGGSSQYDYFSFTLASGQTLTSLKLDSYVSTDAVAWLGIKSGSDWTIGYDTTQMIAQQHFGTANIGSAILGISSANPLVAGTYTVRSQQLGATASYQLDLTVIPEPTTASLFLVAVALRRRLRS